MPRRREKKLLPPRNLTLSPAASPWPEKLGISFEVDLCAGLKANCCELLTGNLFDCTYLFWFSTHSPPHWNLHHRLSGLKRLPNKVKRERRACRRIRNPLHLSCAFFSPCFLVCRSRQLKDFAAVLVTVTICCPDLVKVIYDMLMPGIQNAV